MLTIKHIDQEDREFILECTSFCAERIEGTLAWRYMAFDKDYMVPGNQIGLWAGGCRTGLDYDTLYVMNRFGATVATYHFQPQDLGECFQAERKSEGVTAEAAQVEV